LPIGKLILATALCANAREFAQRFFSFALSRVIRGRKNRWWTIHYCQVGPLGPLRPAANRGGASREDSKHRNPCQRGEARHQRFQAHRLWRSLSARRSSALRARRRNHPRTGRDEKGSGSCDVWAHPGWGRVDGEISAAV